MSSKNRVEPPLERATAIPRVTSFTVEFVISVRQRGDQDGLKVSGLFRAALRIGSRLLHDCDSVYVVDNASEDETGKAPFCAVPRGG